MKKIILGTFFIIFSGIIYFIENDFNSYQKLYDLDTTYYFNGILKSEFNKIDFIANYNIDAELIPQKDLLLVNEEITWINKTNYPTNEIHFHFYANAYKSNKTLFASAFKLSEENKTEIQISNFHIQGKSYELIYYQLEIPNSHDSTTAKVILEKKINPGDTVKIYFEYSLKIPVSIKRFGKAANKNFYFISQWFPKVGVFENGEWVCSQYHPYLNFYSDFGNYNIKIKVPSNFVIASTGIIKEKSTNGKYSSYKIVQAGVHDFAWMVTDEILLIKDTYKRKDGSNIFIYAYIQPGNKRYADRFIECIKNSLDFFEKYIGIYTYQNITLVDVPYSSASGAMEYPTLFTVKTNIFSPIKTGLPEYLVIHEFAHQYFYGLIANNEVYEAWLDEGFASYISAKIMEHYYPEILENFKILKYIPVYGLNFLSLGDIPIVYTVADIPVAKGASSLKNYYQNLRIGTIADTSYKLPSRISYIVNSYDKPELMLLTLERYIGFEKMMSILSKYYEKYKYKHPKSSDFIELVNSYCSEDMNWFWENFYKNSKIFDYRITSIQKVSDDIYHVVVERLGDGIFKNDIVLYTDKDTIRQTWDGKEKWKIFEFITNNKVIAAEIDPARKNLLDINFANNSYTLEPRYWASISITMRWFFWMQNALMILGSIG